jgi:hypothetical protein
VLTLVGGKVREFAVASQSDDAVHPGVYQALYYGFSSPQVHLTVLIEGCGHRG